MRLETARRAGEFTGKWLMRIIFFALGWWLMSCAIARADAGPPPPQYDHEFDGTLIVRNVSEPELYQACRQRWHFGQLLLGCSYPPGKYGMPQHRCVIYLGDARVFAHERAHCNGWPASHPR